MTQSRRRWSMMCGRRNRMARVCCAVAAVLLSQGSLLAVVAKDTFEPPVDYYNSATATGGALLKTQLQSIISVMDPVTYGELRYTAPYTDPDPAVPGNILSVYSRTSMPGTWVENNTNWNREHTWPQSRLGASASNGTANIASDEFSIRPAKASENSGRGNASYGNPYGTNGGAPLLQNSLFYPGNADAGDVARGAFYMATRYAGTLTLVSGTGVTSNEEMGNLPDLLDYHYADTPDRFERYRVHAVYGLAGEDSPAIYNPSPQNNRNPYVDHPEWVWAVFGGGNNNSRLSVNTPSTDGSSSVTFTGNTFWVGSAPTALTRTVTITKAGSNPTYFSVDTGTGITSSMTGRFNAFRATDTTKNITVSYTPDTSTPGLKSSSVIIDNLDITSAGTGTGSLDGNDTITLSATVLARSNASFSLASDTNSLNLFVGAGLIGSTMTRTVTLYNFNSVPGFTAALDGSSSTFSGSAAFSSNYSATACTNIAAGSSYTFTISYTPTSGGMSTGVFTINSTDAKTLSGFIAGAPLTINVSGFGFATVPEPVGLAGPLVLAVMLRRGKR